MPSPAIASANQGDVVRRFGVGKRLVAGARIRPRLLERSPTPSPTHSVSPARRSTCARCALADLQAPAVLVAGPGPSARGENRLGPAGGDSYGSARPGSGGRRVFMGVVRHGSDPLVVGRAHLAGGDLRGKARDRAAVWADVGPNCCAVAGFAPKITPSQMSPTDHQRIAAMPHHSHENPPAT